MNSMWSLLSVGGELFLDTLDVNELKKPVDKDDDRDIALDNKDLVEIAEAVADRRHFNSQTEGFRLFSGGVDEAHQWLTSCPCHDHIWSNKDWSAERQQQEFERETGCKRCWRRGRRGSELARGDFDVVIKRVLGKNSARFQKLLGFLPPEKATGLVHNLERMKRLWVEEILDKVCGWKCLPHLTLGLWPEDQRSQAVATECLRQWSRMENKDDADRITKAFMDDSDAENTLAVGMRRLDETGEASVSLMLSSKEYNILMTHCQRVEGLHAEFKRESKFGKQPPMLCASLNLGTNLQTFQAWEVREFLKANWFNFTVQRVLKFCPLSDAIRKHVSWGHKIKAVYHTLPVQMFGTMSGVHLLLQRWSDALAKTSTRLPPQEKMLIDSFFRRLENRIVSVKVPMERTQVDEAIVPAT